VTPVVTQIERWNIFMGNDLISSAGLIKIIDESRQNALKKVNEELINMYWKVGEFLSRESEYAAFGDAYIDGIADEIQEAFPGIKGFNRRGLYRMKKFYETYKDNEIVTPLVTQISWTNHLLIMSGCKTDEEREFYIRLCIKENYSKRQLERQLDSGYYERYILSKDVLLPESVKKLGENPFLDSYVMEFLDLPNEYHENDLRKALIRNMKDFILELGKDFTFIDEEYKVQVGGDDFRIDLLFFHRGLQCLVAIELKIGKFKPEYISKMDFYLEALDRQVKKENENPSVGLLLCAAKNDEVVEYAMSRTMSPMLVSQYQLQLPDKAVLEKKLQQLVNIPQIED
jgi:predicted nuclease of restriction endonuclease-like (RecB) superfamily